MDPQSKLKKLIGVTLTSCEGAKPGSNEVVFDSTDRRFRMWHEQGCCEGVSIHKVTGDLVDIIGSPIKRVNERILENDPRGYKREYPAESFTWSEFTIATSKGKVVILWLGESNGYYGEGVDFDELTSK